MACSSIPAPGITSDWLHQHCQSRSFLSLRRRACGFHAREIEESTVTSVLNKYGYLRDFMHIGALRKEQKTQLPCKLGTWKRCFCTPADRLRWQQQQISWKKKLLTREELRASVTLSVKKTSWSLKIIA